MLTDQHQAIMRHRSAVYQEAEIGPSKANILLILDTLADLLEHAAETNTRLTELESPARKEPNL